MTHLLAEGGYQVFSLHSTEKTWLYFALVCAVASIVVALFLVRGVLAADQGTATMKDIAKAIQEGAEAFLARQFKTIGIIIVPPVRIPPGSMSACRSAYRSEMYLKINSSPGVPAK